MPGTVTTVDIDARMQAEAFDIEFFNTDLHVIEAEIERVFGGGGSEARIDVIFEDFLSQDRQDLFEQLISAENIGDLPPEIQDRLDMSTRGVSPEELDFIEEYLDMTNIRVISSPDETDVEDILPVDRDPFSQGGHSFVPPEEVYDEIFGGNTIRIDGFLGNASSSLGFTGSTFTLPETTDELLNAPVTTQVQVARYLHMDSDRVDGEETIGLVAADEIEDIDPDDRMITDEEMRQLADITLTIDVTVQNPLLGIADDTSPQQITHRVFTGTVTKVEESNERLVTLHALDRRLQLNRNSVIFDANGQQIGDAINAIMSQLGYERGEDYELFPAEGINIIGPEDFLFETEIHGITWGMDQHSTVFEFLQDLMRKIGGTMHINEYNKIEFYEDAPKHAVWGQRTDSPDMTDLLPPIIEWTNAEEEDETQTVAKASYDETGLGIYSAVSESEIRETLLGSREGVDIGDWSVDETWGGVISRAAVEREAGFDEKTDIMMRDSGTITVIGDPRIQPYDEVVINDDAVNSFAPISTDTYMTKTVRHIFTSSEGYVCEVELGDDPEELFEEFARQAGTPRHGDDIDDEFDDDDGTIWDYIQGIGSSLNPF